MFKYLLLITAFLIALCSGYYSVTGIGQLFVGASLAAMVMAGVLELAKLVTISFTYRYWVISSRLLRSYFIVASFVLMAITSVGVYGYLSSAYASGASGIEATENQIALIETQKNSAEQNIVRLNGRADQLQSFRSQQENRLDSLVGRNGLVTQQRIIQQTDARISALQDQINNEVSRRDSLEAKRVEVLNSISTTSKIGTFWYIAKALGVELDAVVKWFILAIVLVFDPLSVGLILAYNIVHRHTKKETEKISQQEPTQDWIPVRNKEKERVKEPEERVVETLNKSSELEIDTIKLREGINVT